MFKSKILKLSKKDIFDNIEKFDEKWFPIVFNKKIQTIDFFDKYFDVILKKKCQSIIELHDDKLIIDEMKNMNYTILNIINKFNKKCQYNIDIVYDRLIYKLFNTIKKTLKIDLDLLVDLCGIFNFYDNRLFSYIIENNYINDKLDTYICKLNSKLSDELSTKQINLINTIFNLLYILNPQMNIYLHLKNYFELNRRFNENKYIHSNEQNIQNAYLFTNIYIFKFNNCYICGCDKINKIFDMIETTNLPTISEILKIPIEDIKKICNCLIFYNVFLYTANNGKIKINALFDKNININLFDVKYLLKMQIYHHIKTNLFCTFDEISNHFALDKKYIDIDIKTILEEIMKDEKIVCIDDIYKTCDLMIEE